MSQPTPPPVAELLHLPDRVAVITGSGSGHGRAIARRFAEAGATVVVHYRRSESGARELVAAIGSAGARARALQADLTRAVEVERLFAAVVDELDRIDILVNNAGSYPLASLIDMTESEWEAVLNANLKSVHLCTQSAARRMEDGGEFLMVPFLLSPPCCGGPGTG